MTVFLFSENRPGWRPDLSQASIHLQILEINYCDQINGIFWLYGRGHGTIPLSSFTKMNGSAKIREKYQFGDKSGNQRDRVDRINMLIIGSDGA